MLNSVLFIFMYFFVYIQFCEPNKKRITLKKVHFSVFICVRVVYVSNREPNKKGPDMRMDELNWLLFRYSSPRSRL